MGHGRRMSTQMCLVAYELCSIRDGEKCANCGWTYGMKATQIQRKHHIDDKLQRLELNHIDGNPWNNYPDGSNWNLLCRTCNLWRGIGERGGSGGEQVVAGKGTDGKGLGDDVEDDREERTERGRRTSVVRQSVDFRGAGEATMQANAFYERPFRMYCLEQVGQRGQMKWKELRAAGAERVGCSPKTAERYLEKYTSIEGPLKVFPDEYGEKWIMFRTVEKPKARRRVNRGHDGHEKSIKARVPLADVQAEGDGDGHLS